ncbi:helix-turn-helix domain-containing protein [Gracilibacillus dipsosauri]|uniref:Transcriptional regulator n=1 Tax=Gracilibacillus dipsosauri TaxID=178340 RepID=A0A317KTW1_9BACI|nr:helix-turn-helix transcriptional regulator [Gracilibacillus dipsosauri]PWU66746.1 transcriptional regulator [Gracilibacillus dipsosauri]
MDGDRLKRLRKERKLTQTELGNIINVTKVSISGYENGDRTPDTDNLRRLADFFGVTTDYLLGRSDDPNLTEKEDNNKIMVNENELMNLIKDSQLKYKGRTLSKEEKEQVEQMLSILLNKKSTD